MVVFMSPLVVLTPCIRHVYHHLYNFLQRPYLHHRALALTSHDRPMNRPHKLQTRTLATLCFHCSTIPVNGTRNIPIARTMECLDCDCFIISGGTIFRLHLLMIHLLCWKWKWKSLKVSMVTRIL